MQPILAVQNTNAPQGKDGNSLSTSPASSTGIDFKTLLASGIAGQPPVATADPKTDKPGKGTDPGKTTKKKDQPQQTDPTAILAAPFFPVKTDASVKTEPQKGAPSVNIASSETTTHLAGRPSQGKAATAQALTADTPTTKALTGSTQTAQTLATGVQAAQASTAGAPTTKALTGNTQTAQTLAAGIQTVRASTTGAPTTKALTGNTQTAQTLATGIQTVQTSAAGAPGSVSLPAGDAGLSSKSAKGGADITANIASSGNTLPPMTLKASSSQTMLDKPVLPETKKISENQTTQVVLQPADTTLQPNQSVPKLTVDTPVANPSWGTEVGQKIAWMSASDHHVAELHLNPPNLGPMEVKLTIHNDQATIQFVSHHQEVRAALESALPRLREMMMDNGIALGNATVDSGSFQQSAFNQQERPRQQTTFMQGAQPSAMSSMPALRFSRTVGKVDTFA